MRRNVKSCVATNGFAQIGHHFDLSSYDRTTVLVSKFCLFVIHSLNCGVFVIRGFPLAFIMQLKTSKKLVVAW